MTDALKLAERVLGGHLWLAGPGRDTLAQAVKDNHAEIKKLREYVSYWKRQTIGIGKAASDFEECAETAESKLSAMCDVAELVERLNGPAIRRDWITEATVALIRIAAERDALEERLTTARDIVAAGTVYEHGEPSYYNGSIGGLFAALEKREA